MGKANLTDETEIKKGIAQAEYVKKGNSPRVSISWIY